MKHVSVFNGGGIRGIISINLAKTWQKSTPDFVCGTSTGAIIAAAVSIGMPYTKILELYLEKIPQIFQKNFWSFGGKTGSKYSSKNLENAIREIFGTKTNKDCIIPLMINAYNITQDTPKYWKSWQDETFYLADAIIASCSAPTYFMPHTINNDQYVDGGVDTNLCLSGYAEAKRLFKEQIVLSIFGTGKYTQRIRIENGGIMEWINHILDLFMEANSTSPLYILRSIKDVCDVVYEYDIDLDENIPLDAADRVKELLGA